MRITSIFLFTIIIFGGLSCSNDDSLIHNKTKGILEKYPEPTVTITAHNHIPFLAKKYFRRKSDYKKCKYYLRYCMGKWIWKNNYSPIG